jgi:hypothetical protein
VQVKNDGTFHNAAILAQTARAIQRHRQIKGPSRSRPWRQATIHYSKRVNTKTKGSPLFNGRDGGVARRQVSERTPSKSQPLTSTLLTTYEYTHHSHDTQVNTPTPPISHKTQFFNLSEVIQQQVLRGSARIVFPLNM